MNDVDTIVALSTPYGHSSVSIIRISGSGAIGIAKRITKTKFILIDKKATLLSVFIEKDKKIDNALFTYFKNPKSYTGEDIVEVSCHGNPVISNSIINRVCELGGRLADPGEFTKRAFLNGKIDLAQAEAIGGLISAKSEEAALHQMKNLSGTVSGRIKKIHEKLINTLSILEFELDISESETQLSKNVNNALMSIKNITLGIKDLLSSYSLGVAYTQGLRIAIAGEPNAGKSTLMNRLVKSDRSITSAVSGTTRDTITSELIIAGIPTTLVDTAGITETSNKIEKEGISRAYAEIKRADIVISITSPDTHPVDFSGVKTVINVYNKTDSISGVLEESNTIYISALKNQGLDLLLKKIKEIISLKKTTSGAAINTLRQKKALDTCLNSLSLAQGLLKTGFINIELAAFELKSAISSLDGFLGKTTTDDVLDRVFSGFCVGK